MQAAMLPAKRLKLAGYLAMASALLTIPWFLFSYTVVNHNDTSIRASEASMLIGGLALQVSLLLIFQQLLNRRYAFRSADKTISLIIQASITQTANSLLGLAVPELAVPVRMMGTVLLVIVGILQMMLGIWLLQLPSNLGGMQRPYCILNVVTGFAFASILLLPLGMLTNCIADVMLGTIFFQSAVAGSAECRSI